jgi:hypothetical protein
MMRIVYVICATVESGTCEELVLDFTPPVPLACIHAAGPELDRAVPEGWALERWSCLDHDDDMRTARTTADD